MNKRLQSYQLSDLFNAAWHGDVCALGDALDSGVNIDTADAVTGMTALHLAIGRDQLPAAKLLVRRGAAFTADAQGRTPSLLAAVCPVSEEMSNFVIEAESVALYGRFDATPLGPY